LIFNLQVVNLIRTVEQEKETSGTTTLLTFDESVLFLMKQTNQNFHQKDQCAIDLLQVNETHYVTVGSV